jgi:hypothetical protein
VSPARNSELRRILTAPLFAAFVVVIYAYGFYYRLRYVFGWSPRSPRS